MPAGKKTSSSTTGADSKSNIKGYKPPWIKEAAEPNKDAETPWGIMKKRDSIMDPEESKVKKRLSRHEDDDEDSTSSFALPQLRKVSLTKTDKPLEENGEKEAATFVKPQLKKAVKTAPKERQSKKDVTDDGKIIIPKLNSVKVEKMKELPPPPKKDNPDYRQHLKRTPTKDKFEEEKKRGIPPPPPMAPPMPPPAPAMPKPIETDPLSKKQKAKIDSLRSRPKVRPDWTAVLKGIETGPKLKHVQCNDRSKPLLPAVKAKGQFLYESEKATAHNVLLKEIQQGVKLKGVKTNDRSKPNLEGLRKFRRQMTIEEQIQKSVSMASIAPVCRNSLTPNDSLCPFPQEEALLIAAVDDDDEMDDIDKVRDDLQSTKQLLAIEMKNKEQQMRENKRLMQKIQNLEKEKEIEKSIDKSEQEADKKREPDEKLIITLKAEAAEARKMSEELEKKFTQTAKELDKTNFELEEMKRRNSELEKKLQEFLCGKRMSVSDRRESQQYDEDGENPYDDADSDSDEEESEEKRLKRAAREVKMMVNKLRGFKNKVDNAKKERIALKEIMKKHQTGIKEEKKRYKQLQKEVDKITAMMKETDSEEDDEDEEDEENDDSTETESSESESSETESESERSQSEPEDAPAEKKKENLVARTRRHENRLGALKKTNFMLKTNAERLQDELNNQKEMTQTLQADLDSVLAELG